MHTNNFGLLRLVLSVLVLYSHCYPLVRGDNGTEPLIILTRHQATFGSVAVDGFFMISGYLISISWRRSQTASSFALKRIMRIYPGFIVALVFSIGVGLFASSLSLTQSVKNLYYQNDRLVQAIVFLEPAIVTATDSFMNNPFPRAVNGSIWTLQPEIKCYLLVMVLGSFGLISNRRVLMALCLICFGFYLVNTIHIAKSESTMTRFFLMFLLGACVSTIPRLDSLFRPWGMIVAALLLAISTQSRLVFPIAYPVCYCYLLFSLATIRYTPGVEFFARIDLSYGMYLYAFPIQQLVVWGLGVTSPLVLFALALPITTVLAYLSWKLVESPMLNWKHSHTKSLVLEAKQADLSRVG